MAKAPVSQPGKVAGNFPVSTAKGSNRWHFSWPDLVSTIRYGVIAVLGVVPASVLATAGNVVHSAAGAAIAAACGVLVKALQRFTSDTR